MGIWEKMVTLIKIKTPVVTPGPKDKLSTSKPVGLPEFRYIIKYSQKLTIIISDFHNQFKPCLFTI